MKPKSAFKSDNVSQAFGKNLRTIRKKKGFKLEQAGELLGVLPNYLSRLERGESAPNLRFISKLIKTYGVSANELFKGV